MAYSMKGRQYDLNSCNVAACTVGPILIAACLCVCVYICICICVYLFVHAVHRLKVLQVEVLVAEAIEAYNVGELQPEVTPPFPSFHLITFRFYLHRKYKYIAQ